MRYDVEVIEDGATIMYTVDIDPLPDDGDDDWFEETLIPAVQAAGADVDFIEDFWPNES